MSGTIYLPAYTAGKDAYAQAAQTAAGYGKCLLLVGGKRALAAGGDRLIRALGNEAELAHTEVFSGLCTDEEAREIAELAKEYGAHVLCAMGGGRVIDTVKAAGELTGLPVFSFPTIAATCAAVTGLSVMHGPDGSFDRILYLKRPPVHAFIDTEILAQSPPRYLRAGLGDSIGKQVETAFCARGEPLGHSDSVALSIAGGMMEAMQKDAARAMEEIESGQGGEALTNMALLNIISVGCVSLLVRPEFNGALAHSLNYSLENKPGLAGCLHGDMVGWGAAVQLAMDGQEDRAKAVLGLLRAMGTACSLKEMGADISNPEIMEAIRTAARQPDMAFSPYPVSPEMILEAARAVETMAREVQTCSPT